MYYKTVYQSPVGTLTLACDETGGSLVGLWIEGQKYYGGAIRETMTENSGLPGFGSTKKWLGRYFAGGRPDCHEFLWPRLAANSGRRFGPFCVKFLMAK